MIRRITRLQLRCLETPRYDLSDTLTRSIFEQVMIQFDLQKTEILPENSQREDASTWGLWLCQLKNDRLFPLNGSM